MQAVSLISLIDGNLVVPPEAEAALSQMTGPLTVAAFCGRYRGGKSSLLSRLAGSPSAFRVGHSVNACTKGIRFATMGGAGLGSGCPPNEEKRVILLDTEGLCATDSDATHDTRIFALSMLLSSSFFYNIMGTIDEAALSTLRVVIDFASMMVADRGEDDFSFEAMREHMPTFHMLVRDMSLRLERLDGSPMNPGEWLESVLSPESSPSTLSNADDKVSVRTAIKCLFPRRGCFTLPRPSGDEDVLAEMDSVHENRLAPRFVEGVEALRCHLNEAPAKIVCGEVVTGPGLLAMARHLVDRINSGATPRIRDAWALLAELRAKEAATASLRHMHQVTATWATSPLGLDQLERALKKASIEALEMCRATLPEGCGDNEGVLRNLEQVQLPERVAEVIVAARAHKGVTCEADMASHVERGRGLMQQLDACLTTGVDCGFPIEAVTAIDTVWGDVATQLSRGGEDYTKWEELLGTMRPGGHHSSYPCTMASLIRDVLASHIRRLADGGGIVVDNTQLEELRRSLDSSQEAHRELEREATVSKDLIRREAEAELQHQVTEARESGERLNAELRQHCERLQVEYRQAVQEVEVLRGEAVEAKRRVEIVEQATRSEDEQRATDVSTQHMVVVEELRQRLTEVQYRNDALEVETTSLRERVTTEDLRISAALEETRRHADGVIEECSRTAKEAVAKSEAQTASDQQQIQRVQREAQQATSRLSAQLEAGQVEASRLRSANEELRRQERQARLEERQVADALRVEMTTLNRERQTALTQRETEWQRRLEEEQARGNALELRCARLDALNENGKREIDRNLQLVDENKRLRTSTSEAVATRARCELAHEAMQERTANRSRDLEAAQRQLQHERSLNLDLSCKLSVEQVKNGIGQA